MRNGWRRKGWEADVHLLRQLPQVPLVHPSVVELLTSENLFRKTNKSVAFLQHEGNENAPFRPLVE